MVGGVCLNLVVFFFHLFWFGIFLGLRCLSRLGFGQNRLGGLIGRVGFWEFGFCIQRASERAGFWVLDLAPLLARE